MKAGESCILAKVARSSVEISKYMEDAAVKDRELAQLHKDKSEMEHRLSKLTNDPDAIKKMMIENRDLRKKLDVFETQGSSQEIGLRGRLLEANDKIKQLQKELLHRLDSVLQHGFANDDDVVARLREQITDLEIRLSAKSS